MPVGVLIGTTALSELYGLPVVAVVAGCAAACIVTVMVAVHAVANMYSGTPTVHCN